jgi:hypothetical protein
MPEQRFIKVEVDWGILMAEEKGVDVVDIEEETCTQELELVLAPVDGHPGQFRVQEPYTFFGLCNVVNLGDVIETTEPTDGHCTLTRIVKRARPWCRVVNLDSFGRIKEQPLKGLLSEFMEAGGAWECSINVLRFQYPLDDGQIEPPANILELERRISAAVGNKET